VNRKRHPLPALPWALAVVATPLAAYEVNERLSIGGVAALTGQCQELRGGSESDRCRAALAFQPELSFRPAPAHELFVKLGIAAGHGLNDVTPFNVAPWAADLEDSVQNINGGSRDVVLTAWYRYATSEVPERGLSVVAGIIDGTDYVDTNRYSNDEYAQFMNSALVNGPNVFVPSYAPGFAGTWRSRRFSLVGVYMHVGREDDDDFDFYAAQAGYHPETRIGPGSYRVLLATSGRDFDAPDGLSRDRRESLLLSCDQQLGERWGAFVRFGHQGDDAATDYRSLYSGGIDLGGASWGRTEDNVGLGYAYLSGGNGEIARTRVAEAYYRFVVSPVLALTGDLQYMRDDRVDGASVEGWVLGLRAAAHF
jgi:porin